MATNILSQKAMLAHLNVSMWTARRYDQKVSAETNKRHDANDDAGRYNKLLIAKDHMKELNRIASAARARHYELTLPWLDEGGRILPTAGYFNYSKTVREFQDAFNKEADAFAKSYPTMIEEAKTRLKKMFNEGDYPDAEYIRERFDFDMQLMPCPDASDFRVDLADEHREDIRAEIEERMKGALENAMQIPVERIIGVVGHMVDRLNAYKPAKAGSGDRTEGLFRDSLVTNIRDLVELLPSFNLTANKALTDLTKRMQKSLIQHDGAELRQDKDVRKAVLAEAEKILKDAEALLA